MTGLLILETLLLIVIVIWMICISMLYYSLYKGFVALKRMTQKVIPEQNSVISAIGMEMDSFLEIFKAIEDQALDCYDASKRFLREAEENKNIAMHVIDTTRKIQETLKTVSAQEEIEHVPAYTDPGEGK